jgi:hypothetical protein
MRHLTLVLIALSVLATSRIVMAQELSPDAKTLKALAEAGSDLKKPHEINHWLYFSSEADARAAAADLSAAGFSIESVALSTDSKQWRVLALKTIVPTLANVENTSSYLERLAQRHRGDYDGWETQVQE